MKKLQVLAAILSTVAIAGGVTIGSAHAGGCPFSKSATKSAAQSTLPGSGTDKMNPWNANKGLLTLSGLMVLGIGVGYLSHRAGKDAQAAFAAMPDHFDVDAPEEEMGEVREHPEAPGGEFDLTVESNLEVANEVTNDKEVAILK